MMSARHSSLLCMAALLLTSCVSQSIEQAQAPALPTAQVEEKSPASPQPAVRAAPQLTAVPQPTAHPSNEPLAATAAPALPTSSPEVLPTTEAPEAAGASDAPVDSSASLLKRRDPLPEGAAEQLSFGGGAAGGNCSVFGAISEATIEITQISQGLPGHVLICFKGFEPEQDIQAQVTLPDGTSRQNRLRTDTAGTALWEWFALPGDLLGDYAVRGIQGGREAVGSFSVGAAASPKVVVIPDSGPPGTIFQIALGGFQPGTRGALPLYRDEPHYARYITEMPFEIDQRGEARLTLATDADDLPGSYSLLLDTSDNSDSARVIGFRIYAGFSPPATAPSTTEASILQRHDPAPPGAAAFNRDGPCAPHDEPRIMVGSSSSGPPEITLPSWSDVTICVSGYEPGQEVAIAILQPDGIAKEQRLQTDDFGVGELTWGFAPDQPAGRYTATATQGQRRAIQPFTIRRSAMPTIVTRPYRGRVSDTFEVLLDGFVPGQQFDLKLYRETPCSPSGTYLTTLSTITMNQQGNAVYALRTATDDLPGMYGFAIFDSRGNEQITGGFTVALKGLLQVTPDLGADIRAFNILLRDVPPGRCDLHMATAQLFRQAENGSYSYVTSLGLRSHDGSGEATGVLYMRPEDQPGAYLLVVPSYDQTPPLKATFRVPAGG